MNETGMYDFEDPDVGLCFQLANWYSGATILSILLNNHPELSSNGELMPFWDQATDSLLCSCGQNLDNCEFYRDVCGHFRIDGKYDQRIFAPFPEFSQVRAVQRLLRSFRLSPVLDRLLPNSSRYKSTIRDFISANVKLYQNICRRDGSRVYVDGTKSIRRVDIFANYTSIPIKVLYEVRDGRKFAASYKVAQPQNGFSIEKAADLWNGYIESVDRLIRRYPETRVLQIRHEDLCSDTQTAVKDICNFLDVTYVDRIFDFSDAEYHVLGNTMRHGFDGTVRESSKWRDRLSNDEYDRLTTLMQPNLERFGYE
ncbi:MAG: sulfotransferase [Woeseiaceae bacterium]|nr:sulfotransferase [Woeseiaceae bacterium]